MPGPVPTGGPCYVHTDPKANGPAFEGWAVGFWVRMHIARALKTGPPHQEHPGKPIQTGPARTLSIVLGSKSFKMVRET